MFSFCWGRPRSVYGTAMERKPLKRKSCIICFHRGPSAKTKQKKTQIVAPEAIAQDSHALTTRSCSMDALQLRSPVRIPKQKFSERVAGQQAGGEQRGRRQRRRQRDGSARHSPQPRAPPPLRPRPQPQPHSHWHSSRHSPGQSSTGAPRTSS